MHVTLAGTLYQRGNRWWWRVRLPGEEQARPRPLKAKGAKAAVSDRQRAETIAFEMWEQAIRDQAARQIEAQNGQKLATLKAQFLDKVRHFTEIVEQTTAKAEAEARARAEVEAKLARLTQSTGQKTEEAGRRTEEGRQTAEDVLQEAESRGPAGEGPIPTEQGSRSPEPRPIGPDDSLPSTHPPACGPQPPIEDPRSGTGCCECCGAISVPAAQLRQIDSGQRLCPPCLTALRADATRVQPPARPEGTVR